MRRHAIIRGSLRLVCSPLRGITWLIRRAVDHPHDIERLDASAGTLWPDVGETTGYAGPDPDGSGAWPVVRGEAAGT